MQIINCEQGTYEWHALRSGRFTATDASEIHTCKKGLETVALEKATFRITQVPPEFFMTPAMERGKILEPRARNAYRMATGQEVQEVGFCIYDDYVGCSPDGLVGDDGLIEIKCKTDTHHLFAVINNWIDPKHYAQMQFQMLVTGREWCDYVLFNDNFTEHPLYIQTVKRDADFQAELLRGIKHGTDLIKIYERQFKEAYTI